MTTINQEEIQKFSKLAEEWWDVSGKFKPLHMFNPVRIEYILEKTSGHFDRKDKTVVRFLTLSSLSNFTGIKKLKFMMFFFYNTLVDCNNL